jgi:hypothetical protein
MAVQFTIKNESNKGAGQPRNLLVTRTYVQPSGPRRPKTDTALIVGPGREIRTFVWKGAVVEIREDDSEVL